MIEDCALTEANRAWPIGRLRSAGFYVAVGAIAAAVLFSLRGLRFKGGDEEFALSIAGATGRWIFYVRSPLIVWLHRGAYEYVFGPLGLSVADTISLCSAVAGGVYVAALTAISIHPLFLLFNLAAPFTLLFMGHVEHYAWVSALLALYFLSVKRHLERGKSLWACEVWLLLAAGFHMLAVFYAPTFFYLLAERDPATRRWRWRVSRREAEDLLATFLIWAIFYGVCQMSMPIGGLDNGASRLVPLVFPAGEHPYRFTFFSLAHLKMWLYFHAVSSPLGLIGLALLGRRIRGDFEKFLLLATGCAFLWTWMWHPDYGPRDWDLFANLALPLNILVGLLLARAYQTAVTNRS